MQRRVGEDPIIGGISDVPTGVCLKKLNSWIGGAGGFDHLGRSINADNPCSPGRDLGGKVPCPTAYIENSLPRLWVQKVNEGGAVTADKPMCAIIEPRVPLRHPTIVNALVRANSA